MRACVAHACVRACVAHACVSGSCMRVCVRACVRACVRKWELMRTHENFVRKKLWELMGTLCLVIYGNSWDFVR